MKKRLCPRLYRIFIQVSVCIFAVLTVSCAKTPGWYENSEGKFYILPDSGQRAVGFFEIDGNEYYFSEDGYMQTGRIKDEANYSYYYDENGIKQYGFTTYNGKTYYYDETTGAMIHEKTIEIDGELYHINSYGEPCIGVWLINGSTYYFDDRGVMQFGWQNTDGERYFFYDDGTAATGITVIDGVKYGFAAEGELVINGTVGLYQTDENGIATRKPVTDDTLERYIKDLFTEYGSSLSDIYNYITDNFSKSDTHKDFRRDMAINIINNRTGSQSHFAALSYYMLDVAGFEVIFIESQEKSWCAVKTDDGWRHFAPYYGLYLKNDSEMSDAGFFWDFDKMPK